MASLLSSDLIGAASSSSALSVDAASLQRVLGMMRSMQQKMRAERQDIVEGVGSQVRDMRQEQFRIAQAQSQALYKVQALLHRLDVIGAPAPNAGDGVQQLMTADNSAAQRSTQQFSMDTPPSNKTGRAMVSGGAPSVDATEKLNFLQEACRKATEEVELLKVALFQDRLLREDRQKVLDAEDEVLEQRIRQAEAANDAMRSELQNVRSTMRHMVETLESLRQYERREAAPPQFNIYELDRLVLEVEDTVERVRTEHAALHGKLESLHAYCHAEEVKRRETLAKVEASLQAIEKEFSESQSAKRHVPFRPRDVDVSTEWLKGAAGTPSGGGGASLIDPRIAPAPKLKHTLDAMNAHSTKTPHGRRDDLTATLEAFYAIYNPAKVDEVPAILTEYDGAEEELLAALEVHYGCFGYFSS